MRRKKFCGFWASFQYLDDLCDAIYELREGNFKELTTLSPCPRHEILEALGDPQSRVPFFTLAFGFCGVVIAYTMASWMSLDWVLPVSGKPIISVPPFTIIAFELMVLLGAYGTMIGITTLAIRETRKNPFPRDKNYREYNRFTHDRFGLVVRCTSEELESVKKILDKYQPEEIHSENNE